MSTRVDLRSMIHNDIINKFLNPPHHTSVALKTRDPKWVGNEHSQAHAYKLVQRSLREYKMLTHALGMALLIMTLATSALWFWAIKLYERSLFLGGM